MATKLNKKSKLANLNFSWYNETLPESVKEKENGLVNLRGAISSGAQEGEPSGLSPSGAEWAAQSGIGSEIGGDVRGDGSVLVAELANGQNDLSGRGSENTESVNASGTQSERDASGSGGLGQRLSGAVDERGDATQGSSGADDGNQSGHDVLTRSRVSKLNKEGINFDALNLSPTLSHSSLKERFAANIEAIDLLKNILIESRLATADEQFVLSKFSGWGGMAAHFNGGNFYLAYADYNLLGKLVAELVDNHKNGLGSSLEKAAIQLPDSYKKYFRTPEQIQLVTSLQGLVLAIFSQKLKSGKLSEKFVSAIDDYNSALNLTRYEIESENTFEYRKQRDTASSYYEFGSLIKEELILIYGAARASVLNAFYTPPAVSEAMWSGLKTMGLSANNTGIKILDPSLGAGSFIASAPQFVKEASSFCGVELDTLTALISKQLYQKEDIRESGFESARLVDNFFDLAISNIPFGDYKVFDKKFNRHKLSIHNYFFVKALSKVRDGGMVAFITSSYTMDAKGSAHRELINENAELVAAFRLPENVFKGAGVSVSTDIVFLKKRPLSQKLENEEKWINSNAIDLLDNKGNQLEVSLNEYFIAHPENILGVQSAVINQFGLAALQVENDNWLPLLNSRMSSLPSEVYRSVPRGNEIKTIEAPEGTRNGNMIVVDNLVYQNVANVLVRRDDLDSKLPFIRALVDLRIATRDHLKTQAIWIETSERFIESKLALNQAYDNFVANYGYLNSKANRKLIIEEIDSPLLFSLEKWVDSTKTATKADIFLKHTSKIVEDIEVNSISDAIVYSLNECGFIDIQLMADKLEMPEKHIKDELIGSGIAFINPATGLIEEADKYLSGNVREKLVIAKIAKETDDSYAAHVTALEAIQPKHIPASEISIKLGAPWIPIPVLNAFICEISDSPSNFVEVSYEPILQEWKVIFNKGRTKHPGNVKNITNFGSKDFPASMLAEMAMNQKTPKIFKLVKNEPVIDTEKTAQIREVQSKLKAYFSEFFLQNENLTKQVEESYNQKVNNISLREYSGKHLVVPGMNVDFKLRDSQKDGVWRIMSSENNVLLDHAVGAGKTATLIGGAMECRRIGKARKPMIVVPNNILEQMAGNFVELYPSANILVANDYFAGKERRRLFQSQIATGDWDSVIISYSAFEKIAVKPITRARHIQSQLNDLRDVVSSSEDAKLIKRLEKRIKNLEVKLESLLTTDLKDDVVYFEDLGVDMLLVDEADNFKNLGFETKMQRIPGLSDVRSMRAEDMFMKTGLVKKVVFATGTPISNTIGEMYTMMRYLYREKLHEHAIHCFDDFATTFTDTVTAIEMTPDGGGYRMATRFAKFNNVPELMAIYKSFADIKTKEMLNLPVPVVQTKTISAKPSQALMDYIQTLVERSEKVSGGRVDPRDDNKLKITSDGRKAALDLRLVDPLAKDDPGSKVNLMIESIYNQYKSGGETDLLQLVFCDIGISVGTKDDVKFSVYEDIRKKLIAKGMNPSEVKFAQEAKDSNELEKIFSQARDGNVRVLLGSTIKMGAGTNVQKYLSDVHHLDCPWRPRDIEQRNGRGERQGNLNENIRFHVYVTERTFDSYQWQGLETKLGFINQIRNGKSDVRSIEDVSGRALSFSEIKALATGNPLILKKFGLEQTIGRLSNLESGFANEMDNRKRNLESMHSLHTRLERKIDGLALDIALTEKTKNSQFFVQLKDIESIYFNFTGGEYYDEDEASKKLRELSNKIKLSDMPSDDLKIGEFRGFELRYSFGVFGSEILLRGACEHTARYNDNTSIKVLGRIINEFESTQIQTKKELLVSEKELAAMEIACQEKSPYADELHVATTTLDAINKELGILDDDAGDDETDAPVADDVDAITMKP